MAAPESVQASPELLKRLANVKKIRGGLSQVLKMAKLDSSGLQRIRSKQAVRPKSLKRLENAVNRFEQQEPGEQVRAPSKARTPRRTTAKPARNRLQEPAEVAAFIEQATPVVETVRDFISHFENGAERVLGSGKAKRSFERLKEAMAQVE